MEQQPRIVCVVLNSNRKADTLECVASLLASSYANLRVIVLDCQSSDGSVAALRVAFPAVRVVELTRNAGYAGNNNVGIRLALEEGADWVFVLNEDTVLAQDCLALLAEAVRGRADVGIAGPMVYHHDEPDVIQSAGGGLTALWEGFHLSANQRDDGRVREPTLVRWISGCAILVRREAIEAVGVLDERFFIYWEETEWCLRAAKAGWAILHVPGARLWHKGVQRDYSPKPPVTYYSTRNRLLMLRIHRAPFAARAVAWAQIIRTLTSWTVRPKWKHVGDHRDAMWRGVMDYVRSRWGRMP